jgi:hypothetical protein
VADFLEQVYDSKLCELFNDAIILLPHAYDVVVLEKFRPKAVRPAAPSPITDATAAAGTVPHVATSTFDGGSDVDPALHDDEYDGYYASQTLVPDSFRA